MKTELQNLKDKVTLTEQLREEAELERSKNLTDSQSKIKEIMRLRKEL